VIADYDNGGSGGDGEAASPWGTSSEDRLREIVRTKDGDAPDAAATFHGLRPHRRPLRRQRQQLRGSGGDDRLLSVESAVAVDRRRGRRRNGTFSGRPLGSESAVIFSGSCDINQGPIVDTFGEDLLPAENAALGDRRLERLWHGR
jgi:hypothetical protein